MWALTDDGELEPLTTELLALSGASPTTSTGTVHLGNHKLYRRTGDAADKIEAKLDLTDHARHAG